MEELLQEAWAIFADEWGRSCLVFTVIAFLATAYQEYPGRRELALFLHSLGQGSIFGLAGTSLYLFYRAHRSLLEKARSRIAVLEENASVDNFSDTEKWLTDKIDELEALIEDGKKAPTPDFDKAMGDWTTRVKDWTEKTLQGLRKRFRGDVVQHFIDAEEIQGIDQFTSKGQQFFLNQLKELRRTFTADKLFK